MCHIQVFSYKYVFNIASGSTFEEYTLKSEFHNGLAKMLFILNIAVVVRAVLEEASVFFDILEC